MGIKLSSHCMKLKIQEMVDEEYSFRASLT
jgi:hypothetical protein